MIRQEFDADGFWEVVVFYDADYHFFDVIADELKNYGADTATINKMYHMMSLGKAKAVTYSNYWKHISIILFNKHQTKKDYINSIVHEAEHVKQAMLKAYKIEDRGEPPAYTIGYLVSRMYAIFRHFL